MNITYRDDAPITVLPAAPQPDGYYPRRGFEYNPRA